MLKADAPLQSNLMPRLTTSSGISVREDTAFTDAEGKEARKIRERAEDAVQKLQEPLRKILQQDEAVLYVLRALSPVSLLQQITTGWYIYNLTMSMLVVTNRRLLHFPVEPGLFSATKGWKWRNSWRAVMWGDVKEVKLGGFIAGELHLTYLNGKKEKFWNIERKDKKKLAALLPRLSQATQGDITAASGILQLCPRCAATLTTGVYQCASCGQQFKDERTAVIRSILIPGGGYFYTGMLWFGVVDAFVEGILLLGVLGLVLEATGALPADPGQPPAGWDLVVVVLIILALEKAVTIFHALYRVREYLPVPR